MPSNWTEIIKQASQSKLGILALMLLLLGVLALAFFRRSDNNVKILVFVLALIGVALYAKAINDAISGNSLYRVRVLLLYQGSPLEQGRVWSSLGGEAKKVSGGWEFDIPPTTLPSDHELEIYATDDPSFLTGKSHLVLGSDMNPKTTISMGRRETEIRGTVEDERGNTVPNARVEVVGYDNEGVRTGEGGGFVLNAHAADGQQVSLHVEAACCRPLTDYYAAGHSGTVIQLQRRRK
jgi:hypothetical protein